MNSNAVSIIGGCGHVGLPLGLALADRGLDVTLYDVNQRAVDLVNSGEMPFDEPGAPELLPRVVGTRLRATTDPTSISACESVIVVIGTPVDEHLNPDPRAVPESVAAIAEHLRDGQLLVLRSTIYPGVTALVEQRLEGLGLKLDVAFCPERIAEARALTELYDLPQIVAARNRADALFRRLTEQTVHLTPEEAELAKLFTNTWRYIKFATANQLYMIANDFGLDFERIRTALAHDYPRAADLPGAGFAAGPCLFKDTMQLAAFHKNNFTLGHASMLVNEGLPLYVVGQLEREYDLSKLCVGVLGMAFKAETDDTRSSLSYKLKRILRFKAREVLCTDPYVTTDPDLVPLEQVLEQADVLVVATPHRVYANLAPVQPVADVWNVLGQGVRV
jgi:UDP-N-acetyl-D-mannosaminuronic acid dehydrogenase